MRLVALTGGRYHAASLTCVGIARRAARAPSDAGLTVTASASINHLTLNENDIGPYRTFLQAVAAAARRGRPHGAGRSARHPA